MKECGERSTWKRCVLGSKKENEHSFSQHTTATKQRLVQDITRVALRVHSDLTWKENA